MSLPLRRVVTGDGSFTLLRADIEETYHSRHGAIQESMHVFIRAGLDSRVQAGTHELPIRILEVGFGTGTNAWLTMKYASDLQLPIYYETYEPFPVMAEMLAGFVNPESAEDESAFNNLHSAEWNTDIEISPWFTVRKVQEFFGAGIGAKNFDVIFFDAFSPEKEPQLWTQEVFDHCFRALREGGILVTYCSKGDVRRRLQASGFWVEKLPGPPGKREMLRAIVK